MRQVPRPQTLAAALFIALAAPGIALADDRDVYKLIQNQNGFDLPGVSLPQGQDEVRAADGTSCSSSISNAGAYLDIGLIKNNRRLDSNDMATYGRVVIPLGRKAKRLDCSKLYELEVQRLQMELDLLKMGVTPDSQLYTSSVGGDAPPIVAAGKRTVVPIRQKKSWVSEGWTDRGENPN